MSNSLLTVQRFSFKSDWTLGKLSVNNILDGFTVEDEIREVKKHGETAIPYGTYSLSYRQSPKFSSTFVYSDKHNIITEPKNKSKYPQVTDWKNHDLIWIKDVPNFEYVLIHWGNTDNDTDGCLIVGSKIGVIEGQEGVVDSRNYYKKLYCKIYPLIKQGKQTITYTK